MTNNLGKLPYLFIDSKSELVPIWQQHTDIENRYLCTLAITPEQAHKHEEDTVLQSRCKLWHELRAARITSSNAHKVYIRKKNFETLVKTLLDKTQSYPKMVQEAIKHGTQHEPLAREKYCNVLKFQLKRNIIIRETGIVMQPCLFWLAASPDGMVFDAEYSESPGLIEIKCPFSKRNATPQEILEDESFYLEKDENGKPKLKRNHSWLLYADTNGNGIGTSKIL